MEKIKNEQEMREYLSNLFFRNSSPDDLIDIIINNDVEINNLRNRITEFLKKMLNTQKFSQETRNDIMNFIYSIDLNYM